jgi:hypothetical protein
VSKLRSLISMFTPEGFDFSDFTGLSALFQFCEREQDASAIGVKLKEFPSCCTEFSTTYLNFVDGTEAKKSKDPHSHTLVTQFNSAKTQPGGQIIQPSHSQLYPLGNLAVTARIKMGQLALPWRDRVFGFQYLTAVYTSAPPGKEVMKELTGAATARIVEKLPGFKATSAGLVDLAQTAESLADRAEREHHAARDLYLKKVLSLGPCPLVHRGGCSEGNQDSAVRQVLHFAC